MKATPFNGVTIDEKFRERMEKYCNFLKEKYGNKIILVNILFKNIYFTATGEIKNLNKNQSEIIKKNIHLSNAAEIAMEYFGDSAYFINICSKYLPDERFVWGESPVHYEDGFFKDAAMIIKEIIKKQPSQKVFTNLPSEETINERKTRSEKYHVNLNMDAFEQFYL